MLEQEDSGVVINGRARIQGNGMLSGKSASGATFQGKKPEMRASFCTFFLFL